MLLPSTTVTLTVTVKFVTLSLIVIGQHQRQCTLSCHAFMDYCSLLNQRYSLCACVRVLACAVDSVVLVFRSSSCCRGCCFIVVVVAAVVITIIIAAAAAAAVCFFAHAFLSPSLLFSVARTLWTPRLLKNILLIAPNTN